MFVAGLLGVCVLLSLMGLVAPRLSWWPQQGVARSTTAGTESAAQAPGRAGRWGAKPFQTSRKAADKSTEVGRKSRGKLPL